MKRWAVTICAILLISLLPQQTRAEVPSRSVATAETFNVGMLRVERFGTAERAPIVFIPALFCGSWEWNGQVAALSPSHAVFVVTLPGFDGRPMVQGDDLMNRAVRDIRRLITSRHLIHPIVVGHSLGGTLAVLFGEKYSSVMGGIVAVEGGYPIAPTPAMRLQRVNASIKPYLTVDRQTFGPVLRNAMLQYVITSKTDVTTVEHLAARSDPAAVVAWLRAALLLDLTPGLSAIHVPFVEIVPFDGSIDPYQGFPTLNAKRAAYTRWVAHAPQGRVVMIAPSRHFVMFDRPAAFNGALFEAVGQ
jgi:pimeloyl-ACP methyl ester carboxylesterase